MLDPEQTWIDKFKAMKPAKTPPEGAKQLADLVEELTNKVEPNLPGGTASPGVFQFNKAIFLAQLLSLAPTQGPEWIQTIAAAWQSACSASIITPGLVTAPSVWAVSSVDANTLPTAAASIPTIAAGQAIIIAGLTPVAATTAGSPDKSPELFAKAFRNATLSFQFLLIGVAGTPVSPVPLPVPAPAK